MSINQDIKIAVDAVVFDTENHDTKVLIIERKNLAGGKKWALPGGFIENDETPLEAAVRELQEETGVKLDTLVQLHTFGKVDRDPRFRVISVAHFATTLASKHKPRAASDAKEVKWISLNNLPELAFDHAEIIQKAIAFWKK
ncbi:MAG: NUDIX hydrolase [Brumimicrobium sp.]|nr:NUDIX hydrolase [Brumimicrobium sp.]